MLETRNENLIAELGLFVLVVSLQNVNNEIQVEHEPTATSAVMPSTATLHIILCLTVYYPNRFNLTSFISIKKI